MKLHSFLQRPVRLSKPMQVTWHRTTIRSKVLQQNSIWWWLQCRDSSRDSTVVAVLAIFTCYTSAWRIWDSSRDYSRSWIVSTLVSEILFHLTSFVPNFIKYKAVHFIHCSWFTRNCECLLINSVERICLINCKGPGKKRTWSERCDPNSRKRSPSGLGASDEFARHKNILRLGFPKRQRGRWGSPIRKVVFTVSKGTAPVWLFSERKFPTLQK